jgi:hypothetical protein
MDKNKCKTSIRKVEQNFMENIGSFVITNNILGPILKWSILLCFMVRYVTAIYTTIFFEYN